MRPWLHDRMGYEYRWVTARRGSVRHAQLTSIDRATAAEVDRAAQTLSSTHTRLLAVGELACAAITSHALPRVVEPVVAARATEACTLCRQVLKQLEQA